MWSTVSIGEAAANTVSLRSAVAEMAVVDENRSGYERDLFPHWVDEDRDGCNIRKKVLIAKATTPPVVGPRCALVEASGILTMINATWTQQTDLDIDHLVPWLRRGTRVLQRGAQRNVVLMLMI